MRKFNISNADKRDAEVAFEQKSTRVKTSFRTAGGSDTHSEKRLRSTMETEPEILLSQFQDNLANVLIAEDPEIDKEKVGLRLEGLKKVYLTDEGKVAYGVTLAEHVFNPNGSEKEVRPESSNTGNIALDGMPVRWTGKMMPRADAMRRFVFKKSYQLRHVNGLTFDFLQAMAKKLADAGTMMLVGAGAKGIGPLVMQTGGTPYRAFLEGRTQGDSYALILRLTNLELKSL
jgi:hypothetical protein